jgi:hypothetical protein
MLFIGLWRYNYHKFGHYPLSCLLFKNITFRRLGCLRLQVDSTQMGPIRRANLKLGPSEYVSPEDADRIQSPKHNVFKYKMDNVQK